MATIYSQANVFIRRVGDIAWADGFDSGNMFNNYNNTTFSSTYSRVSGSGQGLYFSSADNAGWYAFKTLPTGNYSEVVVHFAFKISNPLPTSAPHFLISFLDNTQHLSAIVINTSGGISFVRKNSNNYNQVAAVLASSSTGLIISDRWYVLEAKTRIHSSLGYIEIKLDGISILNMTTNLNSSSTGVSYFNTIMLVGSDDNYCNTSFDDLYILDNAGNNASYLGDKRVLDLLPSAEGNYSQFGPSTGTDNSAVIDDGATLNDSDYVSGSSAGVKDTYTFTNLPANAQTVSGLMYIVRAMKTDAGTKTLRVMQRQGSTDYERNQSDKNLSNSYDYYTYVDMKNPATESDWTVSDLNTDAEFGFKLQA